MNPHTVLLSILLSVSGLVGLAQDSADVIVYGSTPGGFCAAIAAAREGASVILLEPTRHVGGLSTGGLSHCDSNQMRRETLLGLFDEWHRRVVKDYTDRGLPAPYDPKIKNQALWTFEPHVAMRVTKAMLKEAGVVVRTGRYLKSVTKDGPRITSLITKDAIFRAKVFVDGTYEGDLMAAAGVDWTIGREGRAEFGESYAGKRYPKAKMNISGFDDAGNLLPLVTTSDAGPDDAGDKHLMTYSFRLCLTRDPRKLVPMPAPANTIPPASNSPAACSRPASVVWASTCIRCPAASSTATTPSAARFRSAWSVFATHGTAPMKLAAQRFGRTTSNTRSSSSTSSAPMLRCRQRSATSMPRSAFAKTSSPTPRISRPRFTCASRGA
jgi:FAD dependent oxidoreductase